MMNYYDDILNVYAYLQSKTKENLLVSKKIIDESKGLDQTIHGLNRQADELLGQVTGLAAEMGVDISGIAAGNDGFLCGIEENTCIQESQPRLHLPADFDYQADFQRLCGEAHEAGFIDVHPEELLSAEEMRRAEAIDRELDIRFAESTGLRRKDITVLIIAAMIRSFCFFAGRMMNELQAAKEEGGLGALQSGALRSHQEILQENVPFDAADATVPRKDIMGYDKRLGWLVGVCNLLTGTVTTYQWKSYSVLWPGPWMEKPYIDREISTLSGVVMPVLQNAAWSKKAVIAAVIQEARILNFCHADPGQISTLFHWAVELEERNNAFLENTQSALSSFKEDWREKIDGAETASFINTVTAAVHAVLYDEGDGDIEMYAVRTNKIITYSNAMSSVINSLPAVVQEDIAGMDFAGIMSAFLSLFHSTRFWIEAKSNFLFSEYKKEIDKEMAKVDRYFVFD